MHLPRRRYATQMLVDNASQSAHCTHAMLHYLRENRNPCIGLVRSSPDLGRWLARRVTCIFNPCCKANGAEWARLSGSSQSEEWSIFLTRPRHSSTYPSSAWEEIILDLTNHPLPDVRSSSSSTILCNSHIHSLLRIISWISTLTRF
jgi:hypothetical protein